MADRKQPQPVPPGLVKPVPPPAPPSDDDVVEDVHGILVGGLKWRTPMLTDEIMARAFNEWMRRYTEEPERFQAEFRVVANFLAEQAAGKTPSYGENCTAYLKQIASEFQS